MLIVPPAICEPGATSTGTDSPVSMDWSRADSPSSTTPSAGAFSPGRSTTRSPTSTSVAGTRTSSSSRRSRASFAPSSSRARIAALELRRARASRYRPTRTRVVITAATSKYVCSSSPARSTTADQESAAIVPIEISVSMVAAPWRRFSSGRSVKGPAGEQDDRRREREREPFPARELHGRHHCEHRQRHAEHRGDEQSPSQPAGRALGGVVLRGVRRSPWQARRHNRLPPRPR